MEILPTNPDISRKDWQARPRGGCELTFRLGFPKSTPQSTAECGCGWCVWSLWCGPSRQPRTPVVDQNRESQSTLTTPLAAVLGPPENPSPFSLVHEPERGPSAPREQTILAAGSGSVFSALSTLTVFRPVGVRYPGPSTIWLAARRAIPATKPRNCPSRVPFLPRRNVDAARPMRGSCRGMK